MSIFKVLPAWALWFGLISIVMLAAAFYLVLGRGVEASITRQLLKREQTIARAEVGNIILFFQRFGNSVAVLAQLSSIERRDASTVADMDIFVEQRRDSGLVGGVVLTDRDGVVQFNSNVLGTRDLGKSLADRDFFIWAKDKAKKGEYFINKPVISRLGGSEDQPVVLVASPVYQNGVFAGVVAASVKLAPLAEQFFGFMKVSDLTKAYLVDGRGDLLYSNSVPDGIGLNISELFSGEQTFSDRIKTALSASEEGQFQTKTHLAAYSPISLGAQTWLLIISSPVQEVVDLATPFYVRQAAMLILTSFTILLFGVVATKEV